MTRTRTIAGGISSTVLATGIALALAAPSQASPAAAQATPTTTPAETTTTSAAPSSTSTAPSSTSTAPSSTSTAPSTTAPATTSAPVSVPSGPLYKTPFADDLFAVVDGQLETISFAQWRDDYAFEAPTATATDYLTYAWSTTIYAVSRFPDSDQFYVVPLDFTQWQSVGSPSPTTAALISGSAIIKWASSDELFIATASQEFHKLSPAEWNATGNAAPTDLTPAGFLKLTWNANLGFVEDVTDPGVAELLTFDDWTHAAFPTPLQAQRFAGDQFTQQCGSTLITYAGPTLYKNLTFAEWQAAGSPQPDLRCG